MKIISSKPKKQRFFKSVTITIQYDDKKVRIKRPFWIEPVIEAKKKPLYFNVETGEWGKEGNTDVYYSMTCHGFNNVYSLKAVLRLVRKWKVPKGTKFIAHLPFVGYSFLITKK